MKGIITLDVDGTITINPEKVSFEVLDYLKNLHHKGWQIAFATGRSFPSANALLGELDCPFYLCSLNGASVVNTLSGELVKSSGIDFDIALQISKMTEDLDTDILLLSGFGYSEKSYYRKSKLPIEMLDFFKFIKDSVGAEPWENIDSFSQIDSGAISTIRCYGEREDIERFASRVNGEFDLHVTVISEPYHKSYFAALITSKYASKGNAVKSVLAFEGASNVPIIAAGDDYNDESMLDIATVKIVMPSAPAKLIEKADICALPVEENGIINALASATQMVEELV